MSILARIKAHGGKIVRDRWTFRLSPGRLKPDAIAWVKAHKREVMGEVWPAFDAWEERAAIMEFDGGLSRPEAESAAYAEVEACST